MIGKFDIFDAEETRLAFQNVFRDHPDGPSVLAEIRNRLGVNLPEAKNIVPELIAFDYWLLNMIGIKHELNIMEETKALLSAANDNDLAEARKEAKKKESEDEMA